MGTPSRIYYAGLFAAAAGVSGHWATRASVPRDWGRSKVYPLPLSGLKHTARRSSIRWA